MMNNAMKHLISYHGKLAANFHLKPDVATGYFNMFTQTKEC